MSSIKKKLPNITVPLLGALNLSMLLFLTTFSRSSQEMIDVGVFIAFMPIVLSGLYILLHKVKFSEIRKGSPFYLWIIFSFTILLSELQNGNIFDSIILFSIPTLILFLKPSIKKIVDYALLGTLPFGFAALLGVLLNNNFTSNTIGLLVASILILILCRSVLVDHSFVRSFLVFIVLSILFYVLIKINSRTSILISTVAVVLYTFHQTYRNITKIKQFAREHKLVFSVISTVVLLGVIVFSIKGLNIVFTPKWRPDDISTGRFSIWITSIQNAKLFGHSYNWYSDSGLFGNFHGPHNGMIGILSYGGILSLVFFVFFLISLFKRLTVNYFHKPSNSNFVLLFMLSVSMVKGLTESIVLRSSYQIYNLFIFVPLAFVTFENKDLVIDNLKTTETTYLKTKTSLILLLTLVLLAFVVFGIIFNFNLLNILDLLDKYVGGKIW